MLSGTCRHGNGRCDARRPHATTEAAPRHAAMPAACRLSDKPAPTERSGAALTPRPSARAILGAAHGLDGARIELVAAVAAHELVTIEGRIVSVQVGSVAGRSLEVRVFDETGGIQLIFFGRTHIPGLRTGQAIRATGRAGLFKEHLSLANPRYELLPG